MNFITRVIKNYGQIGAVSRSSKFLYKKMTHSIDFSKNLHIVEFGPGDGIFTDLLLKQINDFSKISLFEIDKGFCKLLREKYKNNPKITIYEKNACNIEDFFHKESIDYVISGLPLAFIEKSDVSEILEKSKNILKKKVNLFNFNIFYKIKNKLNDHFPKFLINLLPSISHQLSFIFVINSYE